ncbi:WD repeat and HMG-box DNA-binding protein 1 [Condylostylus longicornis]|uniref:WD repeat and HMG-box DNA-binding protein 1 n=1 Tax=Condylostylus longicornis TaxID=2530218 RepID=UPI00244DD67F|nr:WD repeat and HMG-box DNA-binding protein 1 [Condylostylus longicornis]
MFFKRSTLRYAHTNGHTHCTYTDDGSTIITCGSDGDMRTWEGIDDDDPSSKCLGEFIVCILHYENRILVSTDLNTVQAYNYPDITRDGTEFRFTAPANCIALNKDYIAAGSEDTDIKVLRRDKSDSEIIFQGHSGPILSLDLSIQNILASVSGDGTLKLWDLNEKIEIKTFDGFPKVRSLEEVKCYGSPSFEPLKGDSLAFCKGKEIIIVNTATFEIQFTLSDDKITSDYSHCKFSSNGDFIVAGTRGGEISMWNFAKRQLVQGETANSECQSITSICWNPKNNGEIAYCDSTGQLGIISTDCTESLSKKERAKEYLENLEDNVMNNFEIEDDGLPGGEFPEENDDGISLEKLKNDTLKANGLDINDNDDKDFETKSIPSISDTDHRIFTKKFKQQEPFQPGAAPDDLDDRYLVWNNIGIVRSINSDDENSIHIEFHDVTTHHALHINNYWNHNMAALSSTVLALSSYNCSKFVCILLGGIGSREWSAELPNCEGIQAITATDNIVAVATDNRFLRIFTAMGTQREVISVPGPVLSICGRDNKLFVTYHFAPATEDQHISALFIQVFGPTLRTKDIRVPLTPEKKLTWIGFSDRGSPVSSDTMGLVQMYSSKTGCWYPICDTMKHTQSISNNFYLIEILESTQQIQAVLCRGSTYPPTTPRPMVSELQMEVPLCADDSQKSKFEENLIRLHTFNVENSERLVKEIALKLFALACHAELERRAKELIEMIGSTAILPMAIKYAASIGRIHLADRLSEMRETVEEQEKQIEKEEVDNETGAFSVLQNYTPNLLTSINKATITPKSVISPKPMVLGSKRNPFKRSANFESKKISNSAENPLSHLVEKALGLEMNKSQLEQTTSTQQSVDTEIEEIPPTPNNENISKNGQTNFMTWFNINKEKLKNSNPELTNAELTKLGMKEYKKSSCNNNNIVNSKNNNDNNGEQNDKLNNNNQKSNNIFTNVGKRKLNDDTIEKQSGVAKLAKFTFKD